MIRTHVTSASTPPGYSGSASVPAPRQRPSRSEDAGPRLDAVTGLIGASQWTVVLGQHLQRAARAPCSASVLVVDLDHFHNVNDNHGRDAGDALLRATGDNIGRRLRASDVLARIAGDQFAVLLWAADEAGATTVGRELITRIANIRLVSPPHTVGGTASVGLVVLDATTGHAESIMGAAAEALERAKSAGGDQLAVHR